jgi:hypothetical protein
VTEPHHAWSRACLLKGYRVPRADDQQRLRTYHGVGLIKPPSVQQVQEVPKGQHREPPRAVPGRKEKAENQAKYGKAIKQQAMAFSGFRGVGRERRRAK